MLSYLTSRDVPLLSRHSNSLLEPCYPLGLCLGGFLGSVLVPSVTAIEQAVSWCDYAITKNLGN